MSRSIDRPSSRPPKLSPWLLPVTIFFGLMLATVMGWRWQSQVQADLLNNAQNQESAAITAEIRERLQLHAHFLKSLQAFASTTPGQDLKRWRRYTQEINLGSNLAGLFGFAYAPAVPPAELPRFISDTRRLLDRDDFRIFPSIENQLVAPITFVAPDTRLMRSTIGFNMLSEASRRQAIETAMLRRDVAMSGPVVLVLDRETRRPGFILFHALYHPGMPLNNAEERQLAFSGLVLTAYRTDEFLATLKKEGTSNFSLQIFDENLAGEQGSSATPALIYDADPDFKPIPGSPVFHHEIDFGGRNWILNFRPKHNDHTPQGLNPSSLILFGGVIGSLLLALLVFYLTTHRARALHYASQLTGELSLSEERLRLAMAASNDGIWDLNLETRDDYMSPRMAQIFGFDPTSPPERLAAYIACIAPEDRPLQRLALRRHLQANTPYDIELRIHKPNGETAWVRVRGEALRNATGHPVRLAGSVADITLNKQAEAAIQAADHLKQSVLDAATEIAIIATDPTGLITVFNRGAEKMLGYTAAEMIGQATPACIHLESEVATRAAEISQLLKREVSGFSTFTTLPQIDGAEQREWTYIRKDGISLTVNLVVTAQRNNTGEITGYLGTAIDITEQKRAECKLRQKHEQLRTVLEHIPGGVSMIDADLNFSMANSSLQAVLDFPDELFASHTPTLYEVALFNARRGEYGPGSPEQIAAAIVAKARHQESHCFERTRPNGKTIEVRGAPLPDGGFVTIYTDITERRQTDEELRQHRNHLQELVTERTERLAEALQQAQAASQAKSDFLANMSHELRTPMHAILSFSELGTERTAAAGDQRLTQYFQRIEQSAQRLLGLINELLDLSKLESGRMELVPKTTEVGALLEQTCAQLEPLLHARGQSIVIESAGSPRSIFADPNRMTQVIYNLLSNAIKFSPHGGQIRIVLAPASLPSGRRSDDQGNEPALAMQFIDAGIGIPENELESIFDKFVQSSMTQSGAGGTGLGLAISRAIVSQHRGTIVATNNAGAGACLTVTLPIADWTGKAEFHE